MRSILFLQFRDWVLRLGVLAADAVGLRLWKSAMGQGPGGSGLVGFDSLPS